ncbi:MAG: HNH endonuclease [Lachnospiraceae bacterium]|nr:HNH endonuclease [Lachnospiraceae bacterium]
MHIAMCHLIRHPWIVKIANVINRNPTAVKMKIGNLGAFDSELKLRGIVGLSKTSHIDEIVWNDYVNNWDKLAYDAEKLLSVNGEGLIENFIDLPIGSEKYVIAKRRINQRFFRDAVLSSYNSRCCISGITEPSLLEAAHIISWTENETERTNPQNGLCLNSFFHKAYDNFLLSVTADFKIILSEKLLSSVKDNRTYSYLYSFQNGKITLPNRFIPNKINLEIHHDKYMSRN